MRRRGVERQGQGEASPASNPTRTTTDLEPSPERSAVRAPVVQLRRDGPPLDQPSRISAFHLSPRPQSSRRPTHRPTIGPAPWTCGTRTPEADKLIMLVHLRSAPAPGRPPTASAGEGRSACHRSAAGPLGSRPGTVTLPGLGSLDRMKGSVRRDVPSGEDTKRRRFPSARCPGQVPGGTSQCSSGNRRVGSD